MNRSSEIEKPEIKKDRVVVFDSKYLNPNTSPLTFQFISHPFASSQTRLSTSTIQQATIAKKDLYILDNFFSPSEGTQMQSFSKTTSFSRKSYGSAEAIEQGEKPALSMSGKKRWQFFSNPPDAITETYKLFSTLGAKLNANVMTLPWELFDQASHGAPAVVANRLEGASKESRELGKHKDYNPENHVPFEIPVLYSQTSEVFPQKFLNGAPGNPWFITVMLYVAADNFLPDYHLGTVFYDEHETVALRAGCSNMRLVLFEGDLLHSIEESHIPSDIETWRVSYVFKLIVNPKQPNSSTKKEFFNWIHQFPNVQLLSLGLNNRG